MEGATSSDTAANERELQGAVETLITKLGMTCLGSMGVSVPVEIEKLGRQPFEDEGGVSVAAILSTSHVAVHTWPARHLFQLDVYSCRDFSPKVVEEWARETLGAFSYVSESWER